MREWPQRFEGFLQKSSEITERRLESTYTSLLTQPKTVVVLAAIVAIWMGYIGSNFATLIEDDVEIGNYCHLRSGVVIKKRTRLMDYIELRSNTVIGEDCYVDSKVSSSGNVIVKNNVTLRYDTILARGVEIGAKTYICPRVMTNNLNSGGIEIGGAKIG